MIEQEEEYNAHSSSLLRSIFLSALGGLESSELMQVHTSPDAPEPPSEEPSTAPSHTLSKHSMIRQSMVVIMSGIPADVSAKTTKAELFSPTQRCGFEVRPACTICAREELAPR